MDKPDADAQQFSISQREPKSESTHDNTQTQLGDARAELDDVLFHLGVGDDSLILSVLHCDSSHEDCAYFVLRANSLNREQELIRALEGHQNKRFSVVPYTGREEINGFPGDVPVQTLAVRWQAYLVELIKQVEQEQSCTQLTHDSHQPATGRPLPWCLIIFLLILSIAVGFVLDVL